MRVVACAVALVCATFPRTVFAQTVVTINLKPNLYYSSVTKEAAKCLATVDQDVLRIRPMSPITWKVNNDGGGKKLCDKHVKDSDVDIVFKDPGVTGKKHGDETSVTTGVGIPNGKKIVRYTVIYDGFVVQDPEIDIDPTAPIPQVPPPAKARRPQGK